MVLTYLKKKSGVRPQNRPNPKIIRCLTPLILSLAFIFVLSIIVSFLKKSGYHITYSATTSMPRGFYLITPSQKFSRYDLVEFVPPPHILIFVKEKHWLPKSGRMLKQIFAVPNDYVCLNKNGAWINNKKIAPIYTFYSENKLLPQTNFCGKLGKNQYLLLSTKNERSFDGRYFGAVSSEKILGKAVPLIVLK